LALHIRRLRQFYGTEGITQTQLAHVVGLSGRRLHDYETCRALPHTVKVLVSISCGLNVPLEELIDPRHLAEIRSEVEVRRAQLTTEQHTKVSAQGGRRSYVR
jgi:transcriptional regulator with XRE-family HTH domain